MTSLTYTYNQQSNLKLEFSSPYYSITWVFLFSSNFFQTIKNDHVRWPSDKKNTSEVAVVHNELKLSKKYNLIFVFWLDVLLHTSKTEINIFTFFWAQLASWLLVLLLLKIFQKNFHNILFMLNSLSQNCTFFHVLSHCVVQATINEWPRTLSLWKKIEQKIDLINLRVILKIWKLRTR